jgi:trans-L-3-hydroxyproline dehydratase
VLDTADFEGLAALIPEIGGKAHITGRSEFWLDPEDRLGSGFLLR